MQRQKRSAKMRGVPHDLAGHDLRTRRIREAQTGRGDRCQMLAQRQRCIAADINRADIDDGPQSPCCQLQLGAQLRQPMV